MYIGLNTTVHFSTQSIKSFDLNINILNEMEMKNHFYICNDIK